MSEQIKMRVQDWAIRQTRDAISQQPLFGILLTNKALFLLPYTRINMYTGEQQFFIMFPLQKILDMWETFFGDGTKFEMIM